MNNIKFKFTEKQYIYVVPESIDKDDCEVCIQCKVIYIDENLGIAILFGYTEAETFHGVFGFKGFNELLQNKLFFDNNKRMDPGFEYNQYCQGLIEDSDVIDKYFFESNSHQDIQPFYTSWFYNDKDGNIIFEISPFYPWFNIDNPENKGGFITYEMFMKNYKVVVRKVISRETLMQWDNQAKLYNPVISDAEKESEIIH